MFNKLLDKPFRIISILGAVFLAVLLVLNAFTDYAYRASIYPYAQIVTIAVQAVVFFLAVVSFFFYSCHYIYYAGIELLVFQELYVGSIYTALFLSSFMLAMLLADRKIVSVKNIIIYVVLEVLKVVVIIPYGAQLFFYYIGLNLFALSTIGCINLLFRHAYEKKDQAQLNLDSLKLSSRQKDCIKEIVLNNTTIKELAINHNISESAIKKDLAQIYKVLGITGKADLKALFIDYQF